MNGCRCRFQEAGASSTARETSSQLSNRRPFNANDRSTFHHGSISLRYAAYFGWKMNSHRANARAKRRTSTARWAFRLSTMA
jgi:hypothetical protein